MFETICERYTVTTVLILPIIDRHLEITPHRMKNAVFPFSLIASMHGFINSFLYVDDSDPQQPGTDIYLMFEAGPVVDMIDQEIDTSYFSLNEMIVSCELFWKIHYTDEHYIVYHMVLPDMWKDDIEIIKSSKYSEVSAKYKKEVILRETSIPLIQDSTMVYLLSQNYAFQILNKTEVIKEEIFKALGTTPNGGECFKKFDTKRETLEMENMHIF